MLTELQTNVLLAFMVLGCLAGIVALKRSISKHDRGGELHAHSDGTVHEHFRGDRPHEHPTFVDRYDAALTRVLGPAPHKH